MINPVLKKFTRQLFWDTTLGRIDMEKNCRAIVERVITRGNLNDWRLLVNYYTLERVVAEAQQLHDLDPRTLAFIAFVGNVPQKSFKSHNNGHTVQRCGMFEVVALPDCGSEPWEK